MGYLENALKCRAKAPKQPLKGALRAFCYKASLNMATTATYLPSPQQASNLCSKQSNWTNSAPRVPEGFQTPHWLGRSWNGESAFEIDHIPRQKQHETALASVKGPLRETRANPPTLSSVPTRTLKLHRSNIHRYRPRHVLPKLLAQTNATTELALALSTGSIRLSLHFYRGWYQESFLDKKGS